MRILWVKAGKLLPVDTGGRIRSYNLLRQLAAVHSVTLLSYYGGSPDHEYDDEIRRQFPGSAPMHVDLPEGEGLRSKVAYLQNLASPHPYAVKKFTSERVKRLISQWFKEGLFDVAVCDFLSASLNFPAALTTPSVLFQHNVESILWRRQAQHEPNPVKRMAFRLEAAKMARYEHDTVARFPHVIAVSDQDRAAMSGMTDPARISVVPTGVDVQQYRAAPGAASNRPLAIFLGSMDWEANVDAVEYFCREIWPSVEAAVPGAMFRIVGRNPHPRVRALASESVAVTGSVPSVIEHLHEASVVVVPLRVGGGTRLKIFEAMASGRAVVSTSIGAEGLEVNDGEDIVLADTPKPFADAVIDLLQNEVRRTRLEQGAARLAARHDWSAIARQFETVLRGVIQSKERTSEMTTAVAAARNAQHA